MRYALTLWFLVVLGYFPLLLNAQPGFVDGQPSESLRSGHYRIGVAGNIPTPTWPPLLKELEKRGYVEGKNLTVVPIHLGDTSKAEERARVEQEMSEKIDIFFSTGNIIPRLRALKSLNTPVCFISIKETATFPREIESLFTGSIRGSYFSTLAMARSLMGGC